MPNEAEIKEMEKQQDNLEGNNDQANVSQGAIDTVKSDLEKTKNSNPVNQENDAVKAAEKTAAENQAQQNVGQNQINENALKDSTMKEKLGIIKDELNVEKSVKTEKAGEKKELEKSTIKDLAESDDEQEIRYKQPQVSKREKIFQELQSEVKQTIIDIHRKLLGLKDKLGIKGIADAVVKAGELSNALNNTLNIIRWNPKNTLIYAVEFGKGLNSLQSFNKSLDDKENYLRNRKVKRKHRSEPRRNEHK